MDIGFECYQQFTALGEGEMVRVLPVVDGQQETVCVLAGSKLAAPVPKGAIPVLEYDLPEKVNAGHAFGDIIGEARIILEGETLAAVPLVAGETLAKRDYAYELERVMRNWVSSPQRIAE